MKKGLADSMGCYCYNCSFFFFPNFKSIIVISSRLTKCLGFFGVGNPVFLFRYDRIYTWGQNRRVKLETNTSCPNNGLTIIQVQPILWHDRVLNIRVHQEKRQAKQRSINQFTSFPWNNFQENSDGTNLPSWEPTYPFPRQFWRWVSFSQGGIC